MQGVGFRWTAAEEAKRRHLTGWVRNLDSGGVEAVFEGLRPSLEAMLRWCSDGPPGAYVRDVHAAWDEPLEHFAGFEIRRSQ